MKFFSASSIENNAVKKLCCLRCLLSDSINEFTFMSFFSRSIHIYSLPVNVSQQIDFSGIVLEVIKTKC